MKSRILFPLVLFAGWLPTLAIQKPLFMLFNNQQADSCSLADYLSVILHGLKLDLTVAGYLTVVPLVLTLASVWFPGKWLQKFMRGYFIAIALLIAIIFTVDASLYPYWGFRLDATLLFYLQSPKDAMASIPSTAYLSVLFLLAFAYAIFWFLKKTILPFVPTETPRRRLTASFALLLLGGLMFIPIRGGVTTSTANVGMVYFSENQFLNHSAINPCFSLFTSLSKQQDFASQFDFFPEAERKALAAPLTRPFEPADSVPRLLTTDQPNILLILLESFSANTIDALGGAHDVTPNLNRLSEEGILFTNFYANSFRTDRGLVSILNGYPAQPTTSIMKYPAKSQTLPSIAKSLKAKGYVSDILYGGDINFTNMRSFFFSSGYTRITSDQDFPLASRLSKWGANDDVTFRHLLKDLATRPTENAPWMTTFLTLSSHEPFEVPYHRSQDPYLNSIAFTDSCLGHFIEQFKALPAWDNTLVILVADHGYRYPETLMNHEPSRYHIPMLWLGGAVKHPMRIETLASQIDLAATLLSQLNLPVDSFSFSKNIFSPNEPHFAFYTYQNGFGFIDPTGTSAFDNDSEQSLTREQTGDSSRLDKGKALLQTLYDDLDRR